MYKTEVHRFSTEALHIKSANVRKKGYITHHYGGDENAGMEMQEPQ